MTTPENRGPTPPVACAVCRKEVPDSEAYVQEAGDYVYHFCGADCFEAWKREATAHFPPPAGHDDAES